MQKELERSRKMQYDLEARMQQMAVQMSTIMASQAASSTAGTPPVATTTTPAESSHRQEGYDFQDVESVVGDCHVVTGDEV